MPFGAMAAATVVSGGLGALSAKSAANTQAGAADRAAQMQLGMFNTIRDDLSPYRGVGAAALPGYQALLGIGGPLTGFSPGAFAGGAAAPAVDWNAYGAANPDLLQYYNTHNLGASGDPRFATPEGFYKYHWETAGQQEGRPGGPMAQAQAQAPSGAQGPADYSGIQRFLESTPGYQFTRDQGMQAVTNQMAAKGLGGISGAYGKGLARFVTGLADNTYQQQLTNYANAAGMGQSAANQTGTFGQAATTNAGNALQGGAAASAAGTVGAANAISGGIQGASNALLTSKILGMYQPTAAAAPGMAGLY